MSILRSSCSWSSCSLGRRRFPYTLSSTRSSPLAPSSSTNTPPSHVRAARRIFVSLSSKTALIKPVAPNLIHSFRPSITPIMAVTTTTQTQTRAHAGHSHNHDNSYLTSTNKADAGVRITRIGLFVNLGMAVGKGLGGYYFHSQGVYGRRCTLQQIKHFQQGRY
jgi:hypothetical protein